MMASLRLNRKDFRILASMRAKEARTLLLDGKQEGAYYLAGYSVECALKACVAKKTKKSEFPPSPEQARQSYYTHDLSVLLKTAGLDQQLEREMQINRALANNWNTVKLWVEASRYQHAGLNGSDLYKAISGRNGVFRWIKRYW
jgi:HEPN domain-containing protein